MPSSLGKPFSEFYSGPMLAPDRSGGKLTQSQVYPKPSSVSDMYAGIYDPVPAPKYNGWGAAVGRVYDPSWRAEPAPVQTAVQAIERAAPALAANGVGYGSGYAKTNNQQLIPNVLPETPAALRPQPTPALDLASMFAGMMGRGQPTMNWEPAAPAGPAPAGDPWGGLRLGVAPAQKPGLVTGARRAPAKSSIADMYSPPPPPKVGYNGKTTVRSNELSGSNKNFGGENALMPSSMNTARWLTGY